MLFSITIPVYNNPEGLRRSLISLEDQTYKNVEVIVVDDGSDLSMEYIINDFKELKIVFFRMEENKGRPAARQKTFELVSGDYCGFLDAGDYYDSSFLETAYQKLKILDLLGVSQSMTILFDEQKYLSSYVDEVVSIENDKIRHLSFASTIFKAKICKEYNFNENLKFSQDKAFLNYVQDSFTGKIATINSYNYIYDQGDKMKVSVLIKKYYFDSLRLFTEKSYTKFVLSVLKIIILPFYHLVFGYKAILKMRYTLINK